MMLENILKKLANSDKFGFVAVKLAPASAERLRIIANALGVKDLISDSEMHATLIYDESDPIVSNYSPSNKSYKARVIDITNMGKPGHDYYAIALKLECPELTLRHKNLIAQGFSSK